jgi:hypothetical protein
MYGQELLVRFDNSSKLPIVTAQRCTVTWPCSYTDGQTADISVWLGSDLCRLVLWNGSGRRWFGFKIRIR